MTKLVASMVVRNEVGRYFQPCVEHLLEFCDEIRIIDDGSDDGMSLNYLLGFEKRVLISTATESTFFRHEGQTRQLLLNWTLQGKPDWILAVDADEFVSDPLALRESIESPSAQVLTLLMREVWEACDDVLCTREDGAWGGHQIPCLWRVPSTTGHLKIADRTLACGRVPTVIDAQARVGRLPESGSDVLHFGWARESERVARHARYVEYDGGRFHANTHLQSILRKGGVRLAGLDWPTSLEPWREQIFERASR